MKSSFYHHHHTENTSAHNSGVIHDGNNYVRKEELMKPLEDVFDSTDQKIREDIVRMICQYLNDEGYHSSILTLMDEANMIWQEHEERAGDVKKMKRALLDGDWPEVDRLCSKPLLKNQKAFLYAVYKQQYLEYIENHEIQKALAHLNKRLKLLESLQMTPVEFKDLCYLLTAKSVHDAPSFKHWEGVTPSREQLAEQFQNMFDFENSNTLESTVVPPKRLMTMLRQAVSYQIDSSRYHPKIAPRVNSLLKDYRPTVIPNSVEKVFEGHTENVKCISFLGENGEYILSGSSDNTVKVWNTETAECIATLESHSSRIWDVSSNTKGTMIASGSGDKTVKLWDARNHKYDLMSTLEGNEGDVYSVRFHPSSNFLVTGGYDKVVRLYDIERQVVVKTFSGHSLSLSRCIFNPVGNLIISGSKDCTIKFWDVVSGLCIKTISSHLGEVTSIEMNSNGLQLLSSSKDNSNRLWDVRMLRPIRRFKGHQNTSKNFIRCGFADDVLVVGGSEDGCVHVWDGEKGTLLQKLEAHQGIVYSAVYNSRQSTLISCSDDCTIRSWCYSSENS